MNKYEVYLKAKLLPTAPATLTSPRDQTIEWGALIQELRKAYGIQAAASNIYCIDGARLSMTRAEYRYEEQIRNNHSDFREFLGYGQGQRRVRR